MSHRDVTNAGQEFVHSTLIYLGTIAFIHNTRLQYRSKVTFYVLDLVKYA